MADIAENIVKKAKNYNCEIHLPVDAVVSGELNDGVPSNIVSIDSIPPEKMVLDVGPETADNIGVLLGKCKTLVWNGPLGVYEKKPFDNSTNVIGRTAAILTKSKNLTSVVGGGDTVAALNNAELTGGFSYVSIAGGALIEWLEGKKLPGLEFLE